MNFHGYGRHSTDKQGVTEDVQRKAVERYYEVELMPKGIGWGGWHYDKAKSAGIAFTERPAGLALWTLLQPGDHVGWHKMDRAFRSVHDGCRNMEMLKTKGVIVHSLDLRIDTSTPLGKFFQTVMLAVAELEKDFIGTRTTEAIQMLRESNRPWGKCCPMGWRITGTKAKKNKRFVPAPVERDLIDRVIQLRLQGTSWNEITWWSYSQTEFESKRSWHLESLRWAVLARQHGFPIECATYHYMLAHHRKLHPEEVVMKICSSKK